MGVCGGFYLSLVITYHEGLQSLSFLSLEYSQAEILFKIKDTQPVAPSLKIFCPLCPRGSMWGLDLQKEESVPGLIFYFMQNKI